MDLKFCSRKFPFHSYCVRRSSLLTRIEDMEIGSEKCDFGVHLDEDCNKLHYVRKSGIRPFSSIESKTQDLLLYRSG